MKLVIKLLAVGALGIVLLVVAAGLALDPLVQGAIEKGGSLATGTRTSVEAVDVGLWSGRIELTELSVDNPGGFRDEAFLRFASARLDADAIGLLSPTVDVPLFALEGLTVNIERTGNGTNYGAILDHLEGLSGGESSTSKPDEPASDETTPPSEAPAEPQQQTLRIGRILVSDVTANVHLDLALAQTSNTLQLERFELNDFESTGTPDENVARLTRAIVRALLDSVAASGGLPADLAADLKGELQSFGQHIGERGSALRGELEGAAQDAGRNVEGAVKDLKRALGGDR